MNIGPNEGHRLQIARSRFATMLIREAHDVIGLNFRQLDEALGYEDGYCRRYSLFPRPCRAPQAGRLQELENRVAKLLLRPPHVVVLENLTETLGVPHSGMNARDNSKYSLWFTYADGWPTYDLLRDHVEPGTPIELQSNIIKSRPKVHELLRNEVAGDKWPLVLRLYAWQWGCLWDRGLPWLSRNAFGVPSELSVVSFVTSEALRQATSLAHGGKWGMKASFYCGVSDTCESESDPPDEYFLDFTGPEEEAIT